MNVLEFRDVTSRYQMPDIIRFLLGGVSALDTGEVRGYAAFPFQMLTKRALVLVGFPAFRARNRS